MAGQDDDLFSEETVNDPYSYLARLRDQDPVHWSGQLNAWLVTRHDDVSWAFRQPRLFSSALFKDGTPTYPPIAAEDEAELAFVKANLRQRITQIDPPDHKTLRAALQPHFTPAAMDQWRATVISVVERLLADLGGKREMDVMRDLAIPMPLNLISEMMQIPEADRRWVREVAEQLLIGPRQSPNRMRDLANAMRQMYAYIEPLADQRRQDPGSDLISLLMKIHVGGVISRDAAMQNIVLLIVAGHETTMNLIANGLLAFVRHPDQWDLLRNGGAELLASAVEECLRYDPPVKSIERVALQGIELRGKNIRVGDRVRLFIASANRDSERFEDADRFDIARTPSPHVAFGHGIHLCLGAALARIEGQVVFGALAERSERLVLLSERIEYAPAVDLRSIRELRLAW